jgi:quinol monooxygenase YgiN
MAIKAIVEFQTKPGQRDELLRLIREYMATMETPPGFLGTTLHEVVGDPNGLLEIAEWESPEARDAFMAKLQQSDALAWFMDLLGAPFRATLVRPLL